MSCEASSVVLLDTILATAVDAIVVCDADGLVTRINPAASAMFGYEPEELLGQSIDLLVPDVAADAHRRRIGDYLRTGEAGIMGHGRDLDALRKDGSICPVHLNIGRCDLDEAPVFVGIMRDLSERNASQRAMEAAKRMELLGQLTGGVAHDFNNILTIVIGNLELLGNCITDPKQHALLDEAMSAAELGTKLIGKLLAHGRNGPVSPVRLTVNQAISESLRLLNRILSPKTSVRYVYRSTIDQIDIDPSAFENALINLVVNAQDAMPDGGEIVISTADVRIDDFGFAEVGLLPGRYVRISVTDNGKGMSDEVKARAFEPFFTTKAPGRGTGLGLATVQGFARQAGGKVTLYSEVGLGTTVSLYFPAPVADPPARGTEPACESETGAGNGSVILVVEDDRAIRTLTNKRIEALGYRTLAAASAAEALDVLEQHPEVAAVFSDVIMPGPLNGFDLAQRIRAERPGVGILMTSGFSGDLLMPPGKSDETLQLLQKPYRQVELAARLKALLPDSRA